VSASGKAPGAPAGGDGAPGPEERLAAEEELARALLGAPRLPVELPSSGGLRLLSVEARGGTFGLVLGREAPSARIVLRRGADGVVAAVEAGGGEDAAALERAAARLTRLSPRRWAAAEDAAARHAETKGEGPRGRVDVERAALLARLKPAIRISASAEEGGAAAARLEAAGAHVVRTRAVIRSEGRARELLYASLDPRLAAELRDVEEPTLADPCVLPASEVVARVRRTGELLGYPPCCVEVFLRRMREELDTTAGPPRLSEAYLAARAAWVPRPHAHLNTLLRPARLQLVSHEPCRFDCAASLVYAQACLAAVARDDPEGARSLERALAMAVVVAPTGARALATVEPGSPPRIASARPAAGSRDPADGALASAVAGGEVGARGAVEGTGAPAPLLVDFQIY